MLEKNKTFCCFCCGSPPLSINISIPVSGYVSGQSIPVKVNVENQSGITVDKVKLILQKVCILKICMQIIENKFCFILITDCHLYRYYSATR